jgi:hypothetical protein
MKAAKAISILLAYILLLIVGMPGVSFLKHGFLATDASRQKFEARHGALWTEVAGAVGDFNRLRRPIAAALGGFQPLFRVRQTWHLYRDGPTMVRRMEVRVNGQPVYRTNDPNLSWNQGVFKNRRIRPMAETLVKKPKAKNRVGLARFIVRAARHDFPEATRVDIVSLWGGRKEAGKPHHRISSRAPEWTLEDKQ